MSAERLSGALSRDAAIEVSRLVGPLARVFAAQPLASAGGRIITSPFQFVTTGEDNLRIVSANAKTGVRVTLQGRRFDEKGQLVAFSFDHVPTTDRTTTTTNHQLGAGALVNLTVFANAGAPSYGQTYVMVQLIRGLTGATIVLGTLLGGYVTSIQSLGWPGSPISSSLEGQGVVRFLTGTDPAAGTQISELVPTGARWELLGFAASLTTSATAGNREVILTADDTVGTFFYASIHPTLHGPSSVARYHWSAGMPIWETVAPVNASREAGLPTPCLLLAGQRLMTEATAFAEGDNWGAPALQVREWLEAG